MRAMLQRLKEMQIMKEWMYRIWKEEGKTGTGVNQIIINAIAQLNDEVPNKNI